MTFSELFEEKRPQLTEKLAAAGTPEAAAPVVTDVLDRLLLSYNEQCETEELAEAAARMIQTARTMVPMIGAVGETRIWQRQAGTAGGRRPMPAASIILFIAGGVLALLSWILMLLHGQGLTVKDGFISLVGIVVPLVIWGLGGWIAGSGKLQGGLGFGRTRKNRKNRNQSADSESRQQVLQEHRIDPEKITGTLSVLLLTMDQILKEQADRLAWKAAREQSQEDQEGPDPETISLMAALLEAACSGDGDYALEQMESIRYYLHRQGIEVVDWDEAHAVWFDQMPAKRTGTLRPALVKKDGSVVKKGLASVGM